MYRVSYCFHWKINIRDFITTTTSLATTDQKKMFKIFSMFAIVAPLVQTTIDSRSSTECTIYYQPYYMGRGSYSTQQGRLKQNMQLERGIWWVPTDWLIYLHEQLLQPHDLSWQHLGGLTTKVWTWSQYLPRQVSPWLVTFLPIIDLPLLSL